MQMPHLYICFDQKKWPYLQRQIKQGLQASIPEEENVTEQLGIQTLNTASSQNTRSFDRMTGTELSSAIGAAGIHSHFDIVRQLLNQNNIAQLAGN